jgi:hypothetical protein
LAEASLIDAENLFRQPGPLHNNPVSTCIIQWETQRPMPKKKRAQRRFKTSVVLQKAISEVGLPADMEVLRAAFYKHHGGAKHSANTAWNRAIEAEGLVFGVGGKLDYLP